MIQTISFMLSIVSYLTSPYAVWFPIAVLATLAVIMILAIIYVLTRALGRTDFGTWVRIKIYDVLQSLIIMIIFFVLITAYFDVNPVPYYQSLGIVPDGCVNGITTPDGSIIPGATDFYSLAACDMYQFISYSQGLNTFIYSAMLLAGFLPSIKIDTGPLIAETGLADSGFFIKGDISIFPIPPLFFAGDLLGAFYPLLVLNQLQLYLLSASLLLFSLMMAIGLIARIFSITKSFGGSMIAFAVGIGVLYPLLVSFTYGFLNAGIVVSQGCGVLGISGLCLLNIQEWGALLGIGIQIITLAVVGIAIPSVIPVGSTTIPALTFVGNIVSYAGIVLLGIALIPFINFLILDTFVIDFSAAIGERIDFMTLLTSII